LLDQQNQKYYFSNYLLFAKYAKIMEYHKNMQKQV